MKLQDARASHPTRATTLPGLSWKDRTLTLREHSATRRGCLLIGRRKDDPHHLRRHHRRQLLSDRRKGRSLLLYASCDARSEWLRSFKGRVTSATSARSTECERD